MFWVGIVIHVILSLLLVLLVLIQNDKGGGLGSLAGGAGNNGSGVVTAETFIQKLTRGVAFAFMLVVLGLSLLVTQGQSTAQPESQLKKYDGLASVLPGQDGAPVGLPEAPGATAPAEPLTPAPATPVVPATAE
jgi:preprotein translocase subunit SecG